MGCESDHYGKRSRRYGECATDIPKDKLDGDESLEYMIMHDEGQTDGKRHQDRESGDELHHVHQGELSDDRLREGGGGKHYKTMQHCCSNGFISFQEDASGNVGSVAPGQALCLRGSIIVPRGSYGAVDAAHLSELKR